MVEDKRKLVEEDGETVEAKPAPVKEDGSQDIKKSKTKRRRRNYDDYDAEVAKEEEESKKVSKSTGAVKAGLDEEDEEDEISDEKLDAMVTLEDEMEDDLAEIDSSNIITTGRRTRGKIIDYKKTAAELDASKGLGSMAGEEEEDDDDEEEEDADFKE